jgi:hypothetical protein
MTDWRQVADEGFGVPVGTDYATLAAELATAIGAADPEVRDGPAYAVLSAWIRDGTLAGQLSWLGDEMAGRFSDVRIEARTFAALVLGWVIEAGAWRQGWVDAFERWYRAETDLRGYDARLGWLHAVAHGADLLGVLGRHPEVPPDRMLALGADRMLADTEYVWRDQEDDRLGHALALTLTRPGLTAEQAVGWLEPVGEKLQTDPPGPVPPFASNTMRTLRVVYLLADRGVTETPDGPPQALQHRAVLLDQLVRTLSPASCL